jgi:hypothetical protein
MLLAGRCLILAAGGEGALAGVTAQAMDGEVLEQLQLMQQVGLASLPLEGAEGVVIFPGGDRSLGFVVATEDRRLRPQLEPGETALYSKENVQAPEEELPEGIEAGEGGNPPLHAVYLKSGRLVNLHGSEVSLYLNGQPLNFSSVPGICTLTYPGIIKIGSLNIPAEAEGGALPPSFKLEAEQVTIKGNSLKIELGGKTFTFSSSNMPARIGVDKAGADTIQEGP